MLCGTPRVGGPSSPRFHLPHQHQQSHLTPGAVRKTDAVQSGPHSSSPIKSTVEEANLKFLGSFQDASLTHLLNALSSSPRLLATPSASASAEGPSLLRSISAPASIPTLSTICSATELKSLPPIPPLPSIVSLMIGVPPRAKLIASSSSSTLAPKKKRSIGPQDYDIDLMPTHSKKRTKSRRVEGASASASAEGTSEPHIAITPLMTLLSQSLVVGISTLSLPLPCPVQQRPMVRMAQDELTTTNASETGSELEEVSELEEAPSARLDKSLYFICKRFIRVCRDACLNRYSGLQEGKVSLAEVNAKLKLQPRRMRDVVTVLCAATILSPISEQIKGAFIFRDPSLIVDSLGQLQERALQRFPEPGMLAGLSPAQSINRDCEAKVRF
jgi:hypothetical protein